MRRPWRSGLTGLPGLVGYTYQGHPPGPPTRVALPFVEWAYPCQASIKEVPLALPTDQARGRFLS